MQEFSIGEVMKITGLARATILYYEQKGLVHPTQRKDSGYRYYSMDDLSRIMLYQNLKQIDVSVGEYADATPAGSDDSGYDLEALLTQKKQQSLRKAMATLAMVRYWDQALEAMRTFSTRPGQRMIVNETTSYAAYTLRFDEAKTGNTSAALTGWDAYFLQRNLCFFFTGAAVLKGDYSFTRGLSCYADCALDLPSGIRDGLHYKAPRRSLALTTPFDFQTEDFTHVFEDVKRILDERRLALDGNPWGNFSISAGKDADPPTSLFLWIPVRDQ